MLARLNLPGWLAFFVYLLIAVILIILIALVVHALGGFDWQLKIGYFVWRIGVT